MAIPDEQRLRDLLHLTGPVPPANPLRREYWDETFIRLGRGYGFEPEAGVYPVDHSGLVEALRPFVSPWLEGARFTQVLPGENDPAGDVLASGGEAGGPGHRYTLRLTLEGRRYGVTFQDISEYFNVNAVLALLNAALETCGTPLRFFGLGDVVVVGPLRGVQQALREGFIPGYEGEGILEAWELESIDAWSESGDTPESLARQLDKGRRRVQVSLVV
ncbi:hypothetical protein [Melittangium boletus]|uniref:hypothetical protein n=1 Tax=Melittangium boletus TaxID=83453 RepID=UPI003DA5DC7D